MANQDINNKFSIRKLIPDTRLAEGEILPRWYGIAFYDSLKREVVCYPIPINLIVRFVDRLWWKIKHPRISDPEADLMAAYTKGHMDGYAEHQRELIRLIDEQFGDKPL